MSDEARALLSSDLVHRYTSRDKFYRGTKFIDEIEEFAIEEAKKLFNCKYADVRPLSGHLCNLAILLKFCRGKKVLSISWKDGGYPGIKELSPWLNIKNLYFPFDGSSMNIKVEESLELIEREKPDCIFFGSSFILFPQPVKIIGENFKGLKVYDASHVLGLIAGKRFQDPLGEGCEFMIGSTHKSFPGPQGGIILSNHEVFLDLEKDICLKVLDNAHWNRIASLAYTLLEMKSFGEKYADQIVKNSKILAKSLYELGVKVKAKDFGFTESHQVILEEDKVVADKLERVNILVDEGVRIGVSEVTRRGMKEKEMEDIAEAIHYVIKDNYFEADKIVKRLVKEFQGIEYTF